MSLWPSSLDKAQPKLDSDDRDEAEAEFLTLVEPGGGTQRLTGLPTTSPASTPSGHSGIVLLSFATDFTVRS